VTTYKDIPDGHPTREGDAPPGLASVDLDLTSVGPAAVEGAPPSAARYGSIGSSGDGGIVVEVAQPVGPPPRCRVGGTTALFVELRNRSAVEVTCAVELAGGDGALLDPAHDTLYRVGPLSTRTVRFEFSPEVSGWHEATVCVATQKWSPSGSTLVPAGPPVATTVSF
jgi:hypothetical protein